MIYAVNKRTKEHRRVVIPPCRYNADIVNWRFVEADVDGWIEWESDEDESPIRGGCSIRLSDGSQYRESDPESWDWSKGGDQWVIAYRPILDTKPEPPAWDGEGLPPVGCVCEYRHKASNNEGWRICKVMGHYNEWVWIHLPDWHPHTVKASKFKFRPIRSEEDGAIEAMKSAMENFPYDDTKQHLAELVYAAIRDGKVPGVKLEGEP